MVSDRERFNRKAESILNQAENTIFSAFRLQDPLVPFLLSDQDSIFGPRRLAWSRIKARKLQNEKLREEKINRELRNTRIPGVSMSEEYYERNKPLNKAVERTTIAINEDIDKKIQNLSKSRPRKVVK